MTGSRPIVHCLHGAVVVTLSNEHMDQDLVELVDDVSEELARRDLDRLVVDLSHLELLDAFMAQVIADIGTLAALYGVVPYLAGARSSVAMLFVEFATNLEPFRVARRLDEVVG